MQSFSVLLLDSQHLWVSGLTERLFSLYSTVMKVTALRDNENEINEDEEEMNFD